VLSRRKAAAKSELIAYDAESPKSEPGFNYRNFALVIIKRLLDFCFSSTAPANFFVGTKKEEKIGRLRSE
jgi:hypothetical protein